MCEHKNFKKQGYWTRCVDCGAARFGEDTKEEWIASSAELAYLDYLVTLLEKASTQQ